MCHHNIGYKGRVLSKTKSFREIHRICIRFVWVFTWFTYCLPLLLDKLIQEGTMDNGLNYSLILGQVGGYLIFSQCVTLQPSSSSMINWCSLLRRHRLFHEQPVKSMLKMLLGGILYWRGPPSEQSIRLATQIGTLICLLKTSTALALTCAHLPPCDFWNSGCPQLIKFSFSSAINVFIYYLGSLTPKFPG